MNEENIGIDAIPENCLRCRHSTTEKIDMILLTKLEEQYQHEQFIMATSHDMERIIKAKDALRPLKNQILDERSKIRTNAIVKCTHPDPTQKRSRDYPHYFCRSFIDKDQTRIVNENDKKDETAE